MDGGMDGRMDGHGRWLDAGWTLGGRRVNAGWTLCGRRVDVGWTGPRKTGTEGGRDGRG